MTNPKTKFKRKAFMKMNLFFLHFVTEINFFSSNKRPRVWFQVEEQNRGTKSKQNERNEIGINKTTNHETQQVKKLIKSHALENWHRFTLGFPANLLCLKQALLKTCSSCFAFTIAANLLVLFCSQKKIKNQDCKALKKLKI